MTKTTATVLEINLRNLEHNYRFLRSKLAPTTKLLAVVKAFAYGSDAIAVALKLQALGADYFAVAYTNEGVQLRDAGITKPILVLHPQIVNFETIIDRCLEPSLYSARVLNAFIAIATEKKQQEYPVHIKFNTGLNRLGFFENDVAYITERLSKTNAVKTTSLFSHLAASEDHNEKEFSLQQIRTFTQIASAFKLKNNDDPFLHMTNTSGILNFPEAHFDMVRTGIGLYGFGNDPEYNKELLPIATLKTIISQIHHIEKGETVGYNRKFKATSLITKTATLPIGHADGITRIFGNEKGVVFIRGKKAPIIGNVCMDMLMIDITDIDCKEGDEVIIFDKQHDAASFAQAGGTISYELLTAISQRVARRIIE